MTFTVQQITHEEYKGMVATIESWMLRGVQMFRVDFGFTFDDSVDDPYEEFRLRQESFRTWIRENCTATVETKTAPQLMFFSFYEKADAMIFKLTFS